MARGNKRNNKTTITPARSSTRSKGKTGATKQTTIELSRKTGSIADTEATAPTQDITMNELVDTDEEKDMDERMEDTVTAKQGKKGLETDRDDDDGSQQSDDTEVNDNGKRPPAAQIATPSSILRHNIRAKHKASIVINPYTPVRNSIRFEDTSSRSTPVKDCATKWRSRFTVKLKIPESNNPLEAFSKVLKELFSELQATCEAEERVFILPWKEKAIQKIDSIDTPDSIPAGFSRLTHFIPRFFPGKGEEHLCYFKVHIGHDKKLEDMQADLKYWLMSGDHGMFFESLQCEDAICIGWLLWSLKSMDAVALADDILQMTGIHVGLRWMAIDTGAKGRVDKADKIHALHLEVARKDKRSAIKAFLELYGKCNNDPAELPLYLRLRFIIPRADATSTHTITKLKRFRERQKNFLNKIGMTPVPSIVHLDWRKSPTAQTLRELMMELKSTVYENTPIFFSVDLDWTQTNHTVTYLPVMKDEATHTLHTLIPLLRYIIENQEETLDFKPLSRDDLHSFFSDEAVEDTEEMYFDEKLGRIVDPLMDANLAFVDDENLLGAFETETEGAPVERPELQQLQTGNFPGNSGDSISTLGRSLATGMLSPGALQAQSRGSRRSRSTASVSSVSTGVSVEDFTDLKRNVTTISSSVERLMRLMEGSLKTQSNQVAFSPGTANADTGAEPL